MNFQRIGFASFLLAAIALSVFVSTELSAQDATAEATPDNSIFDGKIILVVSTGSGMLKESESTFYMSNAKIVEIGNRLFIRGIGYGIESEDEDQQGDWWTSIEMGISWDSVTEYYAFTPKQFEKYLASFDVE